MPDSTSIADKQLPQDDSMPSIGAMKASGQAMDTYLRQQRKDDTPPGATPYTAGMASNAYSNQPQSGMSFQQRLTDLASKAKGSMLRVLGIDSQPVTQLTAPIMPKADIMSAATARTKELEKGLDDLQSRTSITPSVPSAPSAPSLYTLRTAQALPIR